MLDMYLYEGIKYEQNEEEPPQADVYYVLVGP